MTWRRSRPRRAFRQKLPDAERALFVGLLLRRDYRAISDAAGDEMTRGVKGPALVAMAEALELVKHANAQCLAFERGAGTAHAVVLACNAFAHHVEHAAAELKLSPKELDS